MVIKKSTKKCQMKVQQMAFMLLAITLFFILVGMFVLVYKLTGLKKSATQLAEEEAVLLASKIANSPEFSCGESFGTSRLKCVDFDKVMALKENIGRYKNFWDVTNLEIRTISPSPNMNIECDSKNYPDCGIVKLREGNFSGIGVSNFISLCRKNLFEENIENKCEIAKIIISYESR